MFWLSTSSKTSLPPSKKLRFLHIHIGKDVMAIQAYLSKVLFKMLSRQIFTALLGTYLTAFERIQKKRKDARN